MFSFKRTYNISNTQQSSSLKQLQRVHALLLQCAAYLQQQASRLSLHRLRFLLFAFCLLSGCICGWIIISSFRQKEAGELKVTSICLPVPVFKTCTKNMDTGHSIENKWLQVQTWRHFLDSLRGRVLYDRFRSSLNSQLDSLHELETHNYLHQRTKSK